MGVSLAFGLAVLTMAYAVGVISGGHFNPAVSIGLANAGRFSWSQVPGKADYAGVGGFASNGYGDLSPGKFSMLAALIAEVVMTAFFLIIILGATGKKSVAGFAPIAIGLALTLIHLISIPVTNTSVNPARSIAVVVFAGGGALQQVWLFVVAPIVGAMLGAVIHKSFLTEN